jgi:hypothetical protein
MARAPDQDEIPEPQIAALLRKLEWALRQEPVARPDSTIPFYQVDHRFIEAARSFLDEAAHRHPESYRRLMHGG